MHNHDGKPCSSPAYCDGMEALCKRLTDLAVKGKRHCVEHGNDTSDAFTHAHAHILREVIDACVELQSNHEQTIADGLSEGEILALSQLMMHRLMEQAAIRADLIIAGHDVAKHLAERNPGVSASGWPVVDMGEV